MNSPSLFQISAELAPLESALEAIGGEVDGNEALVERVTELLTASQAKADAYGRYAKSLEATIKAIQEEEARLAERRQVFQNRLKRLKNAAKKAMEIRDIAKIEGELYTISLQKNGGKPSVKVLVDTEKLPVEYQRQQVAVDLDKLRDDLVAGKPEAMRVAELGDTGSSVRIK